MTERIGIIGIGGLEFHRGLSDSLEELAHDTARSALADADIDREAIDNVAVCASDLEDGRAISSMVAACPGGAYRKDFIKTTETGIHALGIAAMRMRSGLFDTTLVLSWAKASETEEGPIRRLEADPMYRRGTGLGHRSGQATHAAAYTSETPEATAAAGAVVERNTANAADADGCLVDERTSREAVAETPIVSWPLREGHLPTDCDGACAMVLATESAIEDLGADPVWLDGLGWETAGYDGSSATLGTLEAAAGAGSRAYEEAGVESPQRLDLAELHSRTAFHELMTLEALGLTDDAAGATLDGAFESDGAMPVNPSGGPYAGNPLIATGLVRVAAAANGIADGNAGDAVAHATAGFTDQTHGVAVLRGDDT